MIIKRKDFHQHSQEIFNKALEIKSNILKEIRQKVKEFENSLIQSKSKEFNFVEDLRDQAIEIEKEEKVKVKKYISEIQEGKHGKGSLKIVYDRNKIHGIFPIITIGNIEDKEEIPFVFTIFFGAEAIEWEDVRYIKVNRKISKQELEDFIYKIKRKYLLSYFTDDIIRKILVND